jgi:ATP-dependent helicase/nuclease subunit A
MSKVPPKDAAERLRISTELDRNLLVEAGAGSGKTHEMAARMAAGIASGAHAIEHLAAVTFTRKAAAELRGRFQLALEEELGKRVGRSGLSTAELNSESRLRSALSNLERFFAGTIHAFCARLLRERPVEAGVSPGFTELDETEDNLLRQQSWRDYRSQAKVAGDPDYLALLDAGLEPKHFEAAFNTVCQYEDVEFPPGDAPEPDTKQTWKDLQAFWASLQALMPPAIDPDSTCKTQERAQRFERTWRFVGRDRRDIDGLVKLLECWTSQPKAVLKWWPTKAIAKQAEQLHADFKAAVVDPFLTRWRQYVYRRAVALLVKARDAAKAERRRRNTLSFNDLLLVTAQVLRTNADVRQSLQQKYRWLFVDEFQDTDPVQAEIMFLLAASGEGADWRTVPLRPGALFVVGDPKQSIYRFRRADIDIYNEVRARIGGKDESGLVRLTTNFRSVPGLCDWANDVFRQTFPDEPTQHSPQFAPLDSYRKKEGTTPDLATLTIDDTVASGEVAAEEASRIARYIHSEVAAKRRTYGSFLILTRKRKNLRAYAQALEDLRVPIEVSGAGAFGESDEVRELSLLIRALADPQDAVALVGVLRGRLFGVSDPDLFAFRQAGGYFSLFSEISTASVVTTALASLRRWYSWTRVLPAAAALDRILDDSGFLALAATSPDGVEAGDLLHAVDQVRAILETGLTLSDAADALAVWSDLDDERIKEPAEVDSLPLQPGRPDVVRLMNLHKAKGLEADVVFLVDPTGGVGSWVDVRIERTSGSQALGYFRLERKPEKNRAPKVLAEPPDWGAHEAAEQHYLDAEAQRLLYVAATRARDLLVVGRYTGNRSRPAWAGLDAHLGGAKELVIPAAVATSAPVTVDLSAPTRKKATRAAEEAHHRARRASWAAVSVTSELKAFPRVTPGDDASTAPDDPTRTVTADTPSRRADAGVAWGTLVHGLLEHAMRHKTTTRDDLRRLAVWLTMETPELRVVIEQALDTVQAVAQGEFWQEARASVEVHEEVPFSVKEEREGLATVVSGAIDLAYRVREGWRIEDYKTDRDADVRQLQERYAGQLEAYRRAWEHISRQAAAVSARSAR